MTIKIKDIYGYSLAYDDSRRKFIVEDTDGTKLAIANTQDEAEAKAKAFSKQDFKRISIFRITHDGKVSMGELTSLNRDDKSAWVSMQKGEGVWGSGRQKITLFAGKGGQYYETTKNNMAILESVGKKREIVDKTLNEIEGLIDTLANPINLGYFGFPAR